jgi:3-hydroxybutyryl-CoA dehydratase
MKARHWALEELSVGLEARFEQPITEADLDEFARLSGDHNPLHTSQQFSQGAGYRDRVVHGALLAALASRLVGMELPGQRSLLLSLRLDFVAPTFPGERLEVVGTVESIHPAQRTVVVRLRIGCGGEPRARGSAVVRVEE